MNRYCGKKVLITGGLGFIGSNLARRLVGIGAKVTLVDNLVPKCGGNLFNIKDIQDRLIVKICDIKNSSIMAKLLKKNEFLFNLAGQTSHISSMLSPHIDLDINVYAQLSMLETCRKNNSKIKIVFTSTRQLYGKPIYLPVDEKHPVHPADVNAINKLSAEWYHLLYNKIYGIRTCVLRLTNTYGPGMGLRGGLQNFLGIWISSLLKNKTIKIFGKGKQLRDFNYIDDCVDALLMCGMSSASNGKVYNLGSKEIINLKELAKIIIRLKAGGKFKFVQFPNQKKRIDVGDFYSDFSIINNEIGWKPKIKLKEGLTKTFFYYKKNLLEYI